METLEQAARETRQTGDTASGRTPPKTARLQATHYSQGRRYSDISEDDYASEYGERSVDFESDESANSSDSDVLQKISSLSNQLAKLKTTVDRKNRSKGKMYTGPCPGENVQSAMHSACS
ncbi:MAG: hypothetical protein GY801_10505 [bacterium]|nr:hypothetical protein [bacterium]